jgi:lysophospholipase L1-like esterase
MMKSDWLINNIDGWQKKMNPEVSVILFGTNDLGSLCPPEYTENMAASIRRMLADGTVPMLTTVPPASDRPIAREYWLAGLSIAHGLKVPVIDYYGEIMRRRPDDWDGRLEKFGKPKDCYQVPTLISGDGTHPSNPKQYVNDFSEEALNSNGYNLRDYLTLRKYHEVITKVLKPEGK